VLSPDAFTELALGAGDDAVIRQLRGVQLSKHLMLLRALAGAVTEAKPTPAAVAFNAGYQLLVQVQQADADAVNWLLGLPHLGSWIHDCLARLDRGTQPDLGYLAAAAAAAAVRAGVSFELDAPLRDGRVPLPGLGRLRAPGAGDGWVRLSSDGQRLRVGWRAVVSCAALVPDDGAGPAEPLWEGTPLVRAQADGQAWEVLLERADPHLDRYSHPVLAELTAADTAIWRHRIQAAWELLVDCHQWAAGPIAAGVPVLVLLAPEAHLVSTTSPAAFGAIATALPPSAATLAETLIHEFQHVKLAALLDMVPLIEPGTEQGYAPWRSDPRPMAGIMQGVYAFVGIVRFWDVQREQPADPDDTLSASVLYERWRLAIGPALGTLTGSGRLTPDGLRFTAMLGEQGLRRDSAPVPAAAADIAREIDLDDRLTWQLRHVAVDQAAVTALASAYQRGEPPSNQAASMTWIEADTRKVDTAARSRLLALRYREPREFRQLAVTELAGLGRADALLVRGDPAAALAAYRQCLGAEPDLSAWGGLVLAAGQLAPLPAALACRLPLLVEIHACLAGQGISADPLDLAGWLG
jgi:HEXXH motif-containing protein